MNIFFKYLIYFLIGLIIILLLNRDLIEGFPCSYDILKFNYNTVDDDDIDNFNCVGKSVDDIDDSDESFTIEGNTCTLNTEGESFHSSVRQGEATNVADLNKCQEIPVDYDPSDVVDFYSKCCKSNENPFLLDDNTDNINLFFRIIGTDENNKHNTEYTGCKNYACKNDVNVNINDIKNLNNFELLKSIYPKFYLREQNINGVNCYKEYIPQNILDTLGLQYNLQESCNTIDINGVNNNELQELIYKIKLSDNYIPIDKKTIDVRELETLNQQNKFVNNEYKKLHNFNYCNNSPDYTSSSLIGDKCDNDTCCFNTRCSSDDVLKLQASIRTSHLSGDERLDKIKNIYKNACPENKTLMIDSHCVSPEQCENNFNRLCCSSDIENENIAYLHNLIDTNQNRLLDKQEIQTYLSNIYNEGEDEVGDEGEVRNMDDITNKLLTKSHKDNDIRLSFNDFYSLLNN